MLRKLAGESAFPRSGWPINGDGKVGLIGNGRTHAFTDDVCRNARVSKSLASAGGEDEIFRVCVLVADCIQMMGKAGVGSVYAFGISNHRFALSK